MAYPDHEASLSLNEIHSMEMRFKLNLDEAQLHVK